MSALRMCIAALTGRPWRADLIQTALGAMFLMAVLMIAWSMQGVR